MPINYCIYIIYNSAQYILEHYNSGVDLSKTSQIRVKQNLK